MASIANREGVLLWLMAKIIFIQIITHGSPHWSIETLGHECSSTGFCIYLNIISSEGLTLTDF